MDKVHFGIFVDVMISSAVFWSPIELGGYNGRDIYMNVIENNCQISVNSTVVDSRGIWGSFKEWAMSTAAGEFVLSDAAGAVTGCAVSLVQTGGATAIPNPAFGGIPTAGVVGVIAGAGASINSAIN